MKGGTLLTGILLLALFSAGALTGCSPDETVMRDGYYSAEADSFNGHGWKECVTLYIHNNRIVTVEYNERNASGLIMSWDTQYLSRLKKELGVHPSRLVREYALELLNRQDPHTVRRVRNDKRFYEAFTTLASAAVSQARTGDRAVVEYPLSRPDNARKERP